jgi:hypothetical protein
MRNELPISEKYDYTKRNPNVSSASSAQQSRAEQAHASCAAAANFPAEHISGSGSEKRFASRPKRMLCVQGLQWCRMAASLGGLQLPMATAVTAQESRNGMCQAHCKQSTPLDR